LGLDSLHDGAWFLSAMVSASRADPFEDYLGPVLKYQAPFYLNLLQNSDRLFPQIHKTSEDKAPLAHPWKGRLPLAWDDGDGYELRSGKKLPARYNTNQGPNHLAQDVADALLNLWLTTSDPAVAEALKLLYEERKANFGSMPVLAFAAGYASSNQTMEGSARLPRFAPDAMPGYAGLYQQKEEKLAAYDDPLAWAYGQAMALAVRTGSMDPDFLAYAAARTYGHTLTMELFFADRAWPAGMHLFDIQEPPYFIAGQGRLNEYVADAKKIFGSRGLEIEWVAAGILRDLRRNPEVWEAWYRRNHSDEPLVRMIEIGSGPQAGPIIDGRRDPVYADTATLKAGKSSISLLSTAKALQVLLESTAHECFFTIEAVGPVTGKTVAGVIRVNSDGFFTLTNSLGQTLEARTAFQPGRRWTAELSIPYTVMPGQKQWINGIDNGRYRVSIDGAPPQIVYILSSPERIIQRLELCVDVAIAFHFSMWREKSLIPSGISGPNLSAESWEYGDAGNYAHLMRLIALRVLDRDAESEWEVARRRMPAEPLRVQPLPESVQRAQGLLK
jgi:hypothetical protein